MLILFFYASFNVWLILYFNILGKFIYLVSNYAILLSWFYILNDYKLNIYAHFSKINLVIFG